MDRIAVGKAAERRDLFGESARQLGMSPAIVEKDFWVCWILKRLFAEPSLGEHMVFKGGTSLSKVFGLIDRFSEDIDLILDWRLLGYGTEEGDNPYQNLRSKTQQNRYNQEMNARAAAFIRNTLLGQLTRLLSPVPSIVAAIDDDDPHTINVRYPAAFESAYILPIVRLEIGPLASWVPSSKRTITAYSAQAFPQVFIDPNCAVVAIDAERSFWEKATILHQEAHRPGLIPVRYSRHYYDLYKLASSPAKVSALSDLELLKAVVEFKERFYYASWARYDTAEPGTFRLAPPERQVTALARDYATMSEMFFRDPPKFADVLEGLSVLEREINALSSDPTAWDR